MSVSNIAYFNSTVSKAGWHVAPMALAAGVCIGATVGFIDEINKTNDANTGNPDVKKGINQRVMIVFASWCATPVLAFAGLTFRHPALGILAVASSVVSLAAMLSIKGAVQKNPSSFSGDTHIKLTRAVKYAFRLAIPSIAMLTYTLVIDSLDHLSRRH